MDMRRTIRVARAQGWLLRYFENYFDVLEMFFGRIADDDDVGNVCTYEVLLFVQLVFMNGAYDGEFLSPSGLRLLSPVLVAKGEPFSCDAVPRLVADRTQSARRKLSSISSLEERYNFRLGW